MIITFIAKNAKDSELWKAISKFHDIYLDSDGKAWLGAHLGAHKYIIAAVILEFQQVIAIYVRIANNLKHRLVVQGEQRINSQAYRDANEKSGHVITAMTNLIPGVTLGHLITKPSACKHFYIGDQAAKEKQRADKQLANQLVSPPRNESRAGGPRREQERNTPHTNTPRTTSEPRPRLVESFLDS
jgi:cell division protein FtsN